MLKIKNENLACSEMVKNEEIKDRQYLQTLICDAVKGKKVKNSVVQVEYNSALYEISIVRKKEKNVTGDDKNVTAESKED